MAILADTGATSEEGFPIRRQRSHHLRDLEAGLVGVAPDRDAWLSQAEFWRPNRRAVNLARIRVAFVDLDYHKIDFYARESPSTMLSRVLERCDDASIPVPSLVIDSGQGLQLKWVFAEPLPAEALPRWRAMERYLIDVFSDLGGDPACSDPSRVLRIVGTRNSRANRSVSVVWSSGSEPTFDELCDSVLPISREECREAKQRRKKRENRSQLDLLDGGAGTTTGFRYSSGRALAKKRLDDLRRLVELRGGVKPGERMIHLFWRLNFMALWGAVNADSFMENAEELAQELDPSWNRNTKELKTLADKAAAYGRGETVTYAGAEYPPLYTPRNETLIRIFGISEDEQRQLRTLINKTVAAERHRDRERQRRRKSGAVDRATYERESAECRKPWEKLGISRRSWYRKGRPDPDSGTLAQVRACY